MTLQIDFNPHVSAILAQTARRWGVDPATVLETLVTEYLPPVEKKETPILSAKNAAAIAMLKRRMAEEATEDPEEIRKADEEVEELMQNLNRNRIESGESPLFP